MLTPLRQPFTDLTNQGFNEADADSVGDCVLPISCITQLKQGGSMLVGEKYFLNVIFILIVLSSVALIVGQYYSLCSPPI